MVIRAIARKLAKRILRSGQPTANQRHVLSALLDSRLAATGFLFSAACLACGRQRPVTISVHQGSVPTEVVFELHASNPTRSTMTWLKVEQSRFSGRYLGTPGATCWYVAALRGRRSLPQQIVYGVAPNGFVATNATPLLPGLYDIVVEVDGSESNTTFRIGNNGRATR